MTGSWLIPCPRFRHGSAGKCRQGTHYFEQHDDSSHRRAHFGDTFHGDRVPDGAGDEDPQRRGAHELPNSSET